MSFRNHFLECAQEETKLKLMLLIDQ